VTAWLVIVAIVWHSASTLAVHLRRYRVSDVRQLLLLLLEVFGCGVRAVLLKPVMGFLNGLEKLVQLLADVAGYMMR
jgi:hypothetical protein